MVEKQENKIGLIIILSSHTQNDKAISEEIVRKE